MVVDNDRAKILGDFQVQTDKQVTQNQLDIVEDKVDKKAAAVDVSVHNDCNVRKNLEKLQGLREQMERTWEAKTPPQAGGQTPGQQIPGTTSEISVLKSRNS